MSGDAGDRPAPQPPAGCGTTTALIREGRAGNRVALDELFRRYEGFALGAAARSYLSPTDQATVASDALGSVLIALPGFPDMRGRENLRALLRTVIQRKIANLIRERTRKAGNFGRGDADDDAGHELAARDADPEEQVLVEDAAGEVLTAFAASLAALPGGDGCAEVFADMCRARTVEDTAAARGCSTRTIIRKRDLVVRMLADFFAANGFEITEEKIRDTLRVPAD